MRHADAGAGRRPSSRSSGPSPALMRGPSLAARGTPTAASWHAHLNGGPARCPRARPVIADIPERHAHAGAARIDLGSEEARELGDRVALGRRERRPHRGMVEVAGQRPACARDAAGRGRGELPPDRAPARRERRPLRRGPEPRDRRAARAGLDRHTRGGIGGGVGGEDQHPSGRGPAPPRDAEPVAGAKPQPPPRRPRHPPPAPPPPPPPPPPHPPHPNHEPPRRTSTPPARTPAPPPPPP